MADESMEMTAEILWERLKSSFSEDDGSLPCVEFHKLTAKEVGDIYLAIREQSQLVSKDSTFWDDNSDCDRPIDDVPNAAALVSSYQAQPFHFAIQGVKIDGIELPCVGVQIFQELVALDYRMGDEWNALKLLAFFKWMRELLNMSKAGVLLPSADEGPPNPEAFATAWGEFIG